MKRRLLSLAMVLVMLFGLMPGAAIAADENEEQAAQPLYAYWNSEQPELIEGNSDGCLIGDWGDNWGVLFYTDEDGTNAVPDTATFTFAPASGTDADTVEVTKNDDGSWNIAYNGLGSGVLQTTVDGVVYERAVISRLPYYGFSKGTTITADSYLPYDNTFTYSDTNNTFYYVVDAGMNAKVVGVSRTGSLNWSIDSDGKLVTFTIPTDVDADGEYNIEFSVQNADGSETWTWYSGINLAGTARRIVGQSDYRENSTFYENTDDTCDVSASLNPGYETGRVFYIRENGVVTLAQNYSVSSSDTSVMTVEKLGTATNTGNMIWRILAHKCGTANVVLTFDNGEVLTYPVHVVLPDRGFSSEATMEEDTYLADREFYYTDTGRTFYYVINRDNLTVANVTLEGDLADALDYAISNDGRTVTFTVKSGVTEDLDGDIFFALQNDGDTWDNGYSFEVLNGDSMLVYRSVGGNRENLQENVNNSLRGSVELSPNNSRWISFHLRAAGDVTALQDVTDVVSEDTSIAKVEYLGVSDLGNPVYRIVGKGFGETTITVTYGGGQSLTMPVSVVLPDQGFSTVATLGEDTYMADREFSYTDASRSFYYVIERDDLTISGVTVAGDLADALNYTISSDGRVATFTVKDGITVDLDGDIFIAMTYQDGGISKSGWSFAIVNGSPRMVYRWVEGNRNNLQENLDDNAQAEVTLNPTYTHWVVFCLRSGGTVTALQNITSVVSSDTDVVAVSYMGQTDLGNPAYEIHGNGFGDATITVTYDGGKTLTMPASVILPGRGWFSAPTMTEQNFVAQEFTYTAAAPTLYYVTNAGTLTSFQLASYSSQYADCFDITLASDGSYAAITVKPGAALLGDSWISFEGKGTSSSGGSWNSYNGIRFINGDAPKLGTPSELEWNVDYSWDGTNKSTRMGSVGFKRADLDQARYEIEYYHIGESVTVGEGSWGWGSTNTAEYFSINDFIYNDLPSGEYYFRIRARGDGYNYRSGDWVTSGTWTYTAPQTQLDTPIGLYWTNEDDRITMRWGTVTNAGYYEVETFYAEKEDGVKESTGRSIDIPQRVAKDVLGDWEISEHGDGWYFFRVRAISADITQTCNSEWSAISPGYCLGDVIATVNSALGNIDTTNSTVADVQQAVSVIDNLDEALAADTDNSGTVAAIAKLEQELKEQYGITTGVTVDQAFANDFAATDVQVTGAALNLDTANTTSTTAELTITAVNANDAPPALIETQYKNTVQFAMNIPYAKDTDASTPGLQLAVPVKITLPIPGNINPAFLVVLHYKESTNEWEELSWPHVYQDNNGKWFATFVVDSMSPFALVERQSTATVEEGKIMLDAYLPTTGGNVKFLCAVYNGQGQMLNVVELESHASELVAIEVSEISEGMYLKLLSVNVDGGWVPVAGTQDVPVTLQGN